MAKKQRHVQPDRSKTYCVVEIPSKGPSRGKVTQIFEIDLNWDEAKHLQQRIAAGAGIKKSRFSYVKSEDELKAMVSPEELQALGDAYAQRVRPSAFGTVIDDDDQPLTRDAVAYLGQHDHGEIEALIDDAEHEYADVTAATSPADESLARELEEAAMGDTFQREWPAVAEVVTPVTRGIATGTLPPPTKLVPPAPDWRSQSGERKKRELDRVQRGVGDPDRKDLRVKDTVDDLEPPTVRLPPGPFKPDPDPTKS